MNSEAGRELAEEPKSFRFLDLPKELRLMVYERLPITTTYISQYRGSAFTLVVKSAPTSILATCRLINMEAASIIKEKVERMCARPPKVIVDVLLHDADEECRVETEVDGSPWTGFDRFSSAAFRIPYQSLREEFSIAAHMKVEVAVTDRRNCTRNDPFLLLSTFTSSLWDMALAGTSEPDQNQFSLRCVTHLLPNIVSRGDHLAVRSTWAYTVQHTGPLGLLGGNTEHPVFVQGSPIDTKEWEEEWAAGEQYKEIFSRS